MHNVIELPEDMEHNVIEMPMGDMQHDVIEMPMGDMQHDVIEMPMGDMQHNVIELATAQNNVQHMQLDEQVVTMEIPQTQCIENIT